MSKKRGPNAIVIAANQRVLTGEVFDVIGEDHRRAISLFEPNTARGIGEDQALHAQAAFQDADRHAKRRGRVALIGVEVLQAGERMPSERSRCAGGRAGRCTVGIGKPGMSA